MPILGPFPDGGYELWCGECNSKITCFSPEEIDSTEKLIYYDLFICKDCLKIMENEKIKLE